MTYNERCAEVMQAIERSKVSGQVEEIDVATGLQPWKQDRFDIGDLLDLLDRQLPGQHDGEWAKRPTVWRSWWGKEDGSHGWEIEVTVDPS